MFSTYVGVIHTNACTHFLGCKRAVNSAIFHVFCTFIQGRLVKSKRHIPYRDIKKNSVLLLNMFDMYRSFTLLYIYIYIYIYNIYIYIYMLFFTYFAHLYKGGW